MARRYTPPMAGGMVILFALVPGALSAQPSSDAVALTEEIVVTGSRIKRRDFVAPSPIVTVDRDALLSNGQPTLEEALNELPQVIPEFGRTSNNPGDGTARVNLRGFGSNRTLVLLNGHRVAPSGVGSAVDLNNIPEALVERVEVITGGAATVYGSDAVAGVVNVITRQDFSGFAIDTSLYTTEAGDSEYWDLNAALGFELPGERGFISLYAGYLDREASYASDRAISSVPLVDDWRGDGGLIVSGSDRTPGGVVLGPPADLGDGPTRVTFSPDGNPRAFRDPEDRYNYATLNYLQTPLQKESFGLFGNFRISTSLELYAELSHTRNDARQSLAPVPFSGLVRVNLDNPGLTDETRQVFADNYIPAGPGLVAFGFGRRLEELGSRLIDHNRDYTRGLLGIRGFIADGWEYDIWASHTRSREEAIGTNAISRSAFQQGLLVTPAGGCFDPSGGCVAVNPFGEGRLSSDGSDFIRVEDPVNKTRRDQDLLSGYVSGSPFSTWAGTVDVVVGGEWRRDEGSFESDPSLVSGDTAGYTPRTNVEGEESVAEIFLEALVPLAASRRFAQSLILELGYRYSVYEHAGRVDTWKVGGSWVPVDGLLLRSMFQRAVRAPSLLEAFQDQYSFEFPYVDTNPAEDLCSASADPIGNDNVERCVITGLPEEQIGVFEANVGFPTTFYKGGNPDLEPEEADTFTFGVVLSPATLPNWQLAVDYFDLDLQGGIAELVSTVACFDPLNTDYLFCDTFRRNELTYDVTELYEPYVNRGGQQTRGVDTQIDFTSALPDTVAWLGDGSFSLNLVWTHTFENSLREVQGGTPFDCGGKFGWPCMFAAAGTTFPENRILTRLTHRTGGLTTQLSWHWIDGTTNGAELGAVFQGIPDPEFAIPTVSSRSYIDLAFSYQFSTAIVGRFVVSNLLDKDPPLMADAVTSNNTDTTMFDIFGRSYTFSLSMKF